jgi:large subunit ribosomal protein L7/L12
MMRISRISRIYSTRLICRPRFAHTKVASLVDSISQLSLLETADLVQELRQKLSIAAAAPAAEQSQEQEDKPEAKQEKSVFNVKLESFEAGSKAKIIKEVKGLLGLNLVEAKKFVESAPQILKQGVVKDDANHIKETLEGLGAKVTLD